MDDLRKQVVAKTKELCKQEKLQNVFGPWRLYMLQHSPENPQLIEKGRKSEGLVGHKCHRRNNIYL